MSRKIVAVKVEPEVVAGLFRKMESNEWVQVCDGVPQDAEYRGCWLDPDTGLLAFFFEHPKFDDVPLGAIVPVRYVTLGWAIKEESDED